MAAQRITRFASGLSRVRSISTLVKNTRLSAVTAQKVVETKSASEQSVFCNDCITASKRGIFKGLIDSKCLTLEKAKEMVSDSSVSIANIPQEFLNQELYDIAAKNLFQCRFLPGQLYDEYVLRNIPIIDRVPLKNWTDNFYDNYINCFFKSIDKMSHHTIANYLCRIPESVMTDDRFVSILRICVEKRVASETVFKSLPNKYKTYVNLSNGIGDYEVKFTLYDGESLDVMSTRTGIPVNILPNLIRTGKIRVYMHGREIFR